MLGETRLFSAQPMSGQWQSTNEAAINQA